MSNWLLAVSVSPPKAGGRWAFENWFVSGAATAPEAFAKARNEIADAKPCSVVLINAWDVGDARIVPDDGDEPRPRASA